MPRLGPDGGAKTRGGIPPNGAVAAAHVGRQAGSNVSVRVASASEFERRDQRAVKVNVGRSGPLVFGRCATRWSDPAGLAIADEHDIVYRSATARRWRRPFRRDRRGLVRGDQPDPVLLFRYSAVTFNGHRIHYDQPYATRVEGYPGLVVHGPLVATLLVDRDRAQPAGARPRQRFAFRAMRPLFDTAPFSVCGLPDDDARSRKALDARRGGAVTMEAAATWR